MSLASEWSEPLRLPAELREADRRTIEDEGVSGVALMERAAAAVADQVMAEAPEGPVAVFAGKGNNGGDGLAVARLLTEAGRPVRVYAACRPDEWQGDSAEMLALLGGVAPVPLPERLPEGLGCVVDCLLGTGASGAPEGGVARAVALIAEARRGGALVIACDMPTGVDSGSGEVPGAAVEADLTVTFHAAKPGLWIRPGKDRAGRVVVSDIGIRGDDGPWSIGLIADAVCRRLPARSRSADKFSAGSVVVAGGSPGLTGAPMLAGLGAARAGAGYVTVALPESLLSASDSVPEIMGVGLPEVGGSHSGSGVETILTRCDRAGALVVGPGIGRTSSALEFVVAVALRAECPLVVDADALHGFAGDLARLRDRSAPTVLTPHCGEMGVLLGCERADVEASRLEAARTAAATSGAVVVLKGDDTLVADPSGDVAVSPGGAPALATAGSGDVLSGVVAALLSRGLDPMRAAAAAVRLHLEAGRAAGREGVEGVLAGDVAAALPAARSALDPDERGGKVS